MADRVKRRLSLSGVFGVAVFGLTLAGGTVPAAAADGCPPGHLPNAYTGQCYVVGSAPTIAGVPCVASHLGTCLSFRQNLPRPRVPGSRVD